MDIQKPANFGQQIQTLAKSDNNKTEPFGQTVSDMAHAKNTEKATESVAAIAKKQFNAAIMQSAVNLSASDSPQALVLKTALEGINEALKETLGDNAIQNAYDSGLDVSPEATAERIVSLSTGFFSAYQQQHPELDADTALNSFIDVISGGIDQGFSEARDILGGLKVLEGDIATNIDTTYNLVQTKLQSFIDSSSTTSGADEK
jgi:hypothetical protein